MSAVEWAGDAVRTMRNIKDKYRGEWADGVTADFFDEIMGVNGQRFHGPAEPMVWAVAKMMVSLLFDQYQVVILDATNGTVERRKEWFSNRWQTKVVEVRTSVETCIERAEMEGRDDLISIINRMAVAWEWPTEEEFPGIEEERAMQE